MDEVMESGAGAAAPRRGAALKAHIQEAARLTFFAEGFDGASMDRIAEAAGVTKRTVYGHFSGKEALFAAVIRQGCENVLSAIPQPGSLPPADPAAGLKQLLTGTRALMLSPGCLRLTRIVAAEADRHPAFAAQLEAAFEEGEGRLAVYLDSCVAAGSLKAHDTRVAARLLSDAASRAASQRGVLGAHDEEALARAALDSLADAYLKAWGA